MTDAATAYRAFQNPEPEVGLVLWWFWNGDMSEAAIRHDLEDMHAHGARGALIFPYYGTTLQYLSPEYFSRIKSAVAEARRIGIRLWLMDEGSYPSGFVGGMVTRERPDLRMRVLAKGDRFTVHAGQRVQTQRDAATLALFAINAQTGEKQSLAPGTVWTAPSGDWDVRTVRWEYATSPTRHANRAGFLKDGMYSMFDPLDPAGARFFLESVHEQYRKYIGDEFGKTVMGFMGDEPSVAGLPWTPAFAEEFQRRKGYDVRPHLASLIYDDLNPVDGKLRADYFDVWTTLYDRNYFRPQAEWCARYGMEYIVHLCGEEDTPTFIKLNGDYFKSTRSVQVPGVDAIWRQIWPGVVADFPRLASSSAHLNGRPRAFTESFAVYGLGLTLEQAKWVFDYQAVRGINHFQAMEYLSSSAEYRLYFHPPNWSAGPLWPYFPRFADYVSRLCSLLSLGRPAATLAVYFPTTSGWAGNFEPDRSTWQIANTLGESQYDFDFVDEESLASGLSISARGFSNASGQNYTALIVPPVEFLSEQALNRIQQFANLGGHVLFLGGPPKWRTMGNFKDAQPGGQHAIFSGASAAAHVAGTLDQAALGRLPASGVVVSPAAGEVRCLHRRLTDADIYFFFNESGQRIETTATLQGVGQVEVWDPSDGIRTALPSQVTSSGLQVPLQLEAHATAVMVVSAARIGGKTADLSPRKYRTLLTMEGDWEITLNGRTRTTPLQPWADLDGQSYWGTANYRKQFSFEATSSAERVWLKLGEVCYAARVRLNGKDLGQRAWGPFMWEITSALHSGMNTLEVEVANTRANELAGNPEFQRGLEAIGWLKNSYAGIYLPFDREMLRSGLLGPVVLLQQDQ